MAENRRIDVVIPYYNARETLGATLASIAMQTVRHEIDVTVVDDCAPQGCDDVAARFAPFLSVRVLRTPQNGGPGNARQYGQDHTRNPYLIFIDDDDTFDQPFALAQLRAALEETDAALADGEYGYPAPDSESGEPCEFVSGNWIALHAKMLRRSFLEEHDICSGGDRLHDDASISVQYYQYVQAGLASVAEIGEHVYDYHQNGASITHAGAWLQGQGLRSHVENLRYALSRAGERMPPERALRGSLMMVPKLFTDYEENVALCPALETEVLPFFVPFWRDAVARFAPGITAEGAAEQIIQTLCEGEEMTAEQKNEARRQQEKYRDFFERIVRLIPSQAQEETR